MLLVQGSFALVPASSGGLQSRLRRRHRAVEGAVSMQMQMTLGSVNPLLPPNARRPACWSLKKEAKRKRTILALDGGGVRGIIAASILKVLEHELRNQSNIPDLMIGECFDVVAGTSTGAILATYLTAYCGNDMKAITFPGTEIVLNGSAGSALAMYKEMAKTIFSNPSSTWLVRGPKHAADALEETLEAVMRTTLQDFTDATPKRGPPDWLGPTLLVTAYDMVFRRPVAFVGDRLRGIPDFMRLDHFTFPYDDRALARAVSDYRWAELDKRFQKLKDDPNVREVFGDAHNLTRLGDAELPLGKRRNEPGTARYWKTNPGVKLWEICRCSSAAPTFFKPAVIREYFRWPAPPDEAQKAVNLVACDGGIVANDPAMQALNYLFTRGKLLDRYFKDLDGDATRVEIGEDEPKLVADHMKDKIHKNRDFFTNLTLHDYAVLSIGVGATFREQRVEAAEVIHSAADWLGGDFWRCRGSKGNIIDSLMTSSSTLAHFNLDVAFSNEGVPQQYLRVQCSADQYEGSVGRAPPPVFAALERMDDPSRIEDLKKIGDATAELYRPLIAAFIKDYLLA
ncbi:unnamed protein product [Vitrella brassicaformis CCMP3155]|uniref:PNPLA domain-containing protein n=3 Tax=Vitrella brassicaformis TaxID=1169539 RepID=A0A0G4G816_VITBC|nr:unnamed protein product [Vitrella brassicaformis CCMP3155]|eukprot:CEM24648.1 unnamed protein product [Vitrella brassicaformis CCMP3155]